MSVTDELLKNNERYAGNFDKGNSPAPSEETGGRCLHGCASRPA